MLNTRPAALVPAHACTHSGEPGARAESSRNHDSHHLSCPLHCPRPQSPYACVSWGRHCTADTCLFNLLIKSEIQLRPLTCWVTCMSPFSYPLAPLGQTRKRVSRHLLALCAHTTKQPSSPPLMLLSEIRVTPLSSSFLMCQ